MAFVIGSWNINSVRLRETLVCQLLREQDPDILCLQECKALVEQIPTESFSSLGYNFLAACGQKSYNGVAILSKKQFAITESIDFANLGDARHMKVQLTNGICVHNVYVPAGGDIPDCHRNPKFKQKLDYVEAMRDRFESDKPTRSVLVGDLNIAPGAEDVWSHKQLLSVVSHTPIEVEHLSNMQAAGDWVDIIRQDRPTGPLFSWWSYRARDWQASNRGRRLDHIWATPDLAVNAHSSFILKAARDWPSPSDHAPVFASFDL